MDKKQISGIRAKIGRVRQLTPSISELISKDLMLNWYNESVPFTLNMVKSPSGELLIQMDLIKPYETLCDQVIGNGQQPRPDFAEFLYQQAEEVCRAKKYRILELKGSWPLFEAVVVNKSSKKKVKK